MRDLHNNPFLVCQRTQSDGARTGKDEMAWNSAFKRLTYSRTTSPPSPYSCGEGLPPSLSWLPGLVAHSMPFPSIVSSLLLYCYTFLSLQLWSSVHVHLAALLVCELITSQYKREQTHTQPEKHAPKDTVGKENTISVPSSRSYCFISSPEQTRAHKSSHTGCWDLRTRGVITPMFHRYVYGSSLALLSHIPNLSGRSLHLSPASSGINHISDTRLQPNIQSFFEVAGKSFTLILNVLSVNERHVFSWFDFHLACECSTWFLVHLTRVALKRERRLTADIYRHITGWSWRLLTLRGTNNKRLWRIILVP